MFSKTIGKVVRFILRFIAGGVAGIVGGFFGTIRHAGGAIASAVQWNGEDCKKHLKSGLADFGRLITFGLMPAFGYGFAPDLYFAKGDTRSDGTVPRKDSLSPVQQEWAAIGCFSVLPSRCAYLAILFLRIDQEHCRFFPNRKIKRFPFMDRIGSNPLSGRR